MRASIAGDDKVQPVLTVINGSQTGQVIAVEPGVGRHESCDALLIGRGVSRKHLRSQRVGDEVTVEELQSTNGTLINGEVTLQRRLFPGDRIQLGPDICL